MPSSRFVRLPTRTTSSPAPVSSVVAPGGPACGAQRERVRCPRRSRSCSGPRPWSGRSACRCPSRARARTPRTPGTRCSCVSRPVSSVEVSVPVLSDVSALSSARSVSRPPPPCSVRRARKLSSVPPSLEPSSSNAREPASTRSSPSPRSTLSARFRPRTASVSLPPLKLTDAESTRLETLIVAGVALPSSSLICVLAQEDVADGVRVARVGVEQLRPEVDAAELARVGAVDDDRVDAADADARVQRGALDDVDRAAAHAGRLDDVRVAVVAAAQRRDPAPREHAGAVGAVDADGAGRGADQERVDLAADDLVHAVHAGGRSRRSEPVSVARSKTEMSSAVAPTNWLPLSVPITSRLP